jgi:hypothetical protein
MNMKSDIRYLLSITLILGISVIHGDALACSCGDRSVRQIVETSGYIFVAEITSAKKNPDADSLLNRVAAEFEVLDVIKGAPQELNVLHSGIGGGDCGIPFLVGHVMLVFTNDGTVTTCGASRSIKPDGDSEYIGQLKAYVNDGTEFDFEHYPQLAGVIVLDCKESF